MEKASITRRTTKACNFFNNYFTILHLMTTLTEKGLRAGNYNNQRKSKCPLGQRFYRKNREVYSNFNLVLPTNYLLCVGWINIPST
nr:unnamed protein product [Callosobruchus analis]